MDAIKTIEKAAEIIEFADKEITRLEAERDALKAENENLKDQIQMLADCLNGSSKAKYTAEMYDALRDDLAAAQKRIAELETVEWVTNNFNDSAGDVPWCPWCKEAQEDGHAPDCVRDPK